MRKIKINVQLDPNKIINFITIAIVILITMGSAASLIQVFTPYKTAMGIIQLFDMDRERTVTSYFSALDLGFAAILLGFITSIKRKSADPYRKYWLGLTIGFVFLSIDENVSMHELVIILFKDHQVGNTLPPHYMTTIIGCTAVAFLFLIYTKFLWHLPTQVRKRFLFSGAVFVLGAFGAEWVGGYLVTHQETWPLGYSYIEVIIEESLEMIGILLFVRALFLYIIHILPVRQNIPQQVVSLEVPVQADIDEVYVMP